ncbi:low affinity ammonium transporter [Trichomonascus vanleenenianus]|uniref:MFS transporter n=1 Tax=Trichomonascus vanleenenianus TaxID=2268995 RepID=UPI003ECA542E
MTLEHDYTAEPLKASLSEEYDKINQVATSTMQSCDEEKKIGPRASALVNHPPEASNPKTDPPMSLFREVIFLTVILCAQLFLQAGIGMVNAIVPILADWFHDGRERSWYVGGYALAVGTFILPAGRLGDMYGHKKMFTLGFVWMSLWSLITGLSRYVRSTAIFFDVCRGLQGLGPALMAPNGLALLGRVYPEGSRKNLVFGLFGACAPIGFFMGSLFGSLFAQLTTWSWAFYLTAICAAIVALAAHFCIPCKNVLDEARCRAFDYWGCLTGVTGLVLFQAAWIQAQIVGWTDPYTYILLILGIVFFAAFIYVESHIADQPLIPLSLCPTTTLVTLVSLFFGYGAFGIWLVFLYQIWAIRDISALLTVAYVVPIPISGTIAALVSGKLMFKVPTWSILTIASIAFVTAVTLVATMPLHQTYWTQAFISIIIEPWGVGMGFPAATLLLSEGVQEAYQGIAASLVNTVVNYGVITGISMAQTVQFNIVPSPQNPSEFLKGIHSAAYVGIGFGALSLVVSLGALLRGLKDRHRKT